MEFKDRVNDSKGADNEEKYKLLSRVYCHTEGIWINEWDTHVETAYNVLKDHQTKTDHSVTIHYK